MTFLGLAVLEDPVRPEAAEAVKGISPRRGHNGDDHGDHKNTALAVAKAWDRGFPGPVRDRGGIRQDG